MISAVILAGGKGTRMGAGFNKIFLRLGDKEIITRTISVFEKCPLIDEIIIVSAANDIERMQELIAKNSFKKITAVTEGGALRQNSVYNGLLSVRGDIVLIHDGARCLITEEELEKVINDAKNFGAAALGVTVKDTLKSIDGNGNIISTVNRDRTVHIQTPQAFKTKEILELHKRLDDENVVVTDDCAVFEHYGKTVHVTMGSYDNIKLTTPEDIYTGEKILQRRGEK